MYGPSVWYPQYDKHALKPHRNDTHTHYRLTLLSEKAFGAMKFSGRFSDLRTARPREAQAHWELNLTLHHTTVNSEFGIKFKLFGFIESVFGLHQT